MALKDSEFGIWINKDIDKYSSKVMSFTPRTDGKYYYLSGLTHRAIKFDPSTKRTEEAFVIVAPKHLGEWL